MGKIEKYKQILQVALDEYASRRPVNMPEVERHLITNPEQSQFVLFSVGWHGARYLHQCLIHVQIRESKIWIHQDLTDPGLMERLMEKGVLEEDLVLAFVPVYERLELEAVLQ